MTESDAASERGSNLAGTSGEGERYTRLRGLFLQLREHGLEERERQLQEIAETDAGMVQELRGLLDEPTDDPFLVRPIDLASAGIPPSPIPSRSLPQTIAGFRILRELGHGGMGVVYLAEQATPRRLLALKVLREGVSGDSLARFRREIEALGRLRHPGIAQIHEAGVERADGGERPWFAMEYVEGRSLAAHVREERLTAPGAIALFLQVCDAVQAAHEGGILHRDIKPENILIEASGRARLVDFGVARLTGSDLAAATLHTATGELVGTLAYMSPEQTSGGREPLDARSDVYALGVVLYELLTGELPYTKGRVLLHELVRAIREEDPRPLTTLRRELDEELETIVGKALEKDPARRYASAAALAADLRRHLADQPILARRPSPLYQLAKFARRHRGLVGGMVATVLALTMGLVAALLALGRAQRAEEESMRERDALALVTDLQAVELLTQRAETLFPATPARLPDLEGWLAEARAILVRQTERRAQGDSTGASIRSESRDRAGALEAALEGFTDPERGVLPALERRAELARTLEARTITDHAEAWRRALTALADPSGPYRGLALRPQLGLVPLGPDPESGLQEFAHYGGSGEVPARDEKGRVQLVAGSGLVFVLLPGGTYVQGSPDAQRDQPEGPPRPVTLDPFFLSKFELTQGQWQRVTGKNPSQHEVGTAFDERTTTALHPVEFVSRLEAEAVLARLDLTLPTEAQWEYAVRAGSTTPFPTGEEPASLAGAGNLQYGNLHAPKDPVATLLADPWVVHAPVGSFPPSRFGLHDMLGNVKEWCLDPWFGDYHERPLRAGDGLVLGTSDGHFAIRGGSWGEGYNECHSAYRTDGRDEWRQPWIGARPARGLH